MNKAIGKKFCSKFCQIILAVLLVLIGVCIWQSIFYVGGEESLNQYNPWILIFGSVLLLLIGAAAAHFLERCSRRTMTILSVIFFAVIFGELLFFGFHLKYIPSYDLIHIKAEAADMLNTGEISNVEYYAKYPNQQPVTILLFFLFSIFKFLNFTDYNTIGILCNIAAILISVGFVYKICCFWSAKAGVISLFFFMIDPMLFSWASYYYTDTLCMPFMLAGIWLFLKAEKMESGKKRALLTAAAGFIIIIGGKIRVTAAFALIAVIVWNLIKLPFSFFLKRTGILLIGAVCAVLLSGMVLKTYGVENKNYEYPITHWIKLGLNAEGDGAYTIEDEKTTKAQPTYQKKIEENIKTIRTRMEKLGTEGVEKLYLKKMTRTWATAAYTEPLQLTVERYNTLYKYTIGRSSVAFQYWLQIVRCTMLMLAFAGCIFALKRKGNQDAWMFILILGGIVFYLFWEAKPKYSLCFLPILYIIETYSIIKINRLGSTIFVRNRIRRVHWKRWVNGIICAALLFTAAEGILMYSKCIAKQKTQEDLRVNQVSFFWKGRIDEIGSQGISQTFMADGSFNRVKINFRNPDHIADQTYILEIKNSEGKIINKKEFSSNGIKHNQMHTFKINTVKGKKEGRYRLTIRPKQKYAQTIGVNSAVYSLYDHYRELPDYYPDGCLYHGKTKQKDNDLAFVISNEYKDSSFSKIAFFIIWGFVFAAEISVSIYFKRIMGGRNKNEGDLISGNSLL